MCVRLRLRLACEQDGWCTLMAAVRQRRAGLVELLLGAGANHDVLVPQGDMLVHVSRLGGWVGWPGWVDAAGGMLMTCGGC